MSYQLAIFLCIVFIVTLFVIDKNNRGETSWAWWIPLLWFLIAGSRPIVLWINPSSITALPEDSHDSSPADRIFYIFLIISGLLILIRRKLNWSIILNKNLFVFLFFFYCGISIIWSDAPVATFNAWVKMTVVLIMALIIITDVNPVETARAVIKRASFVLIPLSIVLIKYYPTYGRSYSKWTGVPFSGGVTMYKNGLGILCMVQGLFLVWDLIKLLRDKSYSVSRKPILISMILIGMVIWLLTMADSATAVAGFIVGVFTLVVLEIPVIKSKIKNLNVVVFSFLIAALFVFLSFNTFEGLVHSLGRDITLTGRTVIWERVLNVDINPVLGTGYSSFWHGERGASLLDLNNIPLTQSHNGYIEVYLNLGFIGLALLALMIIKTYINAKNMLLADFQFGKLLISYFAVVLLGNITEATFATKGTFWFMFILISLQYVHQKKPVEISDASTY